MIIMFLMNSTSVLPLGPYKTCLQWKVNIIFSIRNIVMVTSYRTYELSK